jgi:phospholipid/cholesterol/gamma-HCH transport system substrate-binding protein
MTVGRAAWAVGALTVLALVAVVIGVASVDRGIGRGPGSYWLHARFDDVTGLAEGTKVTIAGIRVGQVERLQLLGQTVDVRVRLASSVRAFAGQLDATATRKNGAVLTRLQASLLGDFYLELAPGAAGPVLREGDAIPTVITATALQQTLAKVDRATTLIPQIDQIASDIGAVTRNLATVWGGDSGAVKLDELSAHLVEASRDLAAVTRGLRERLEGGQIDKGIQGFSDAASQLSRLSQRIARTIDRADADLGAAGGALRRTLADAEAVAADVRAIVGQHKDEAGNTVRSASRLTSQLETLAGRVDRIVAAIERGEGNVGRLLRDDTLMRQTEQLVDRSGSLVRRYTDLELGLDYRIAAHGGLASDPDRLRWQSHLTLRLQPRADRFVTATLTRNNLASERTFSRVTESAGGTDPPLLRERFVEVDPSPLLWGLQYARRLGPWTLRGGLIEGTAGAGLDWALWPDRLQLSADVFRFASDAWPRLRGSLVWRALPYVYAWAGGDELLYPGTRADLFYGLGLSLTDNDLLVLFTAAPKVQLGN